MAAAASEAEKEQQHFAENLADCAAAAAAAYGWLSPRISFSTDFGLLEGACASPRREESRENHHSEWSKEFEFSLSIEQPPCGSSCASPADEIFCEGKLLPLQLLGPSSRIQLVKQLLREEYSGSTSSAERSSCPSPMIVKSASYPPVGCASPSALAPTCSTSLKEIFGLRKNSKNRYSFKLVRLFFRRHLGDFGKGLDGFPPKSPVLLPGKEKSKDDDQTTSGTDGGVGGGVSTLAAALRSESEGSSSSTRISIATTSVSSSGSSKSSQQMKGGSSSSTINSGRILWRNLERCSRSFAEQQGKGSSSSSSSSSNRGRKQQQQHGGGAEKGDRSISSAAGSFSSNVRVAPVLNVPMCMGPVSSKEGRSGSSTMAGLRKLLNGKKMNLQRVSWACPGGAI